MSNEMSDLSNVSLSDHSKERLTLRKDEKLRHKSIVESLFRNGKTLYEFPLRATWMIHDEKSLEDNFRNHVPERIGNLQMLISVPKKKRKKAIDRVLLRRRIREAYRLTRMPLKNLIKESEDIRLLSVAFVYLDTKNADYAVIEKKMKSLLRKISSAISDSR